MPTPRRPWPNEATTQHAAMVEICERLWSLLYTGANYNLDVIQPAVADVRRLKLLVLEVQDIKEESLGRWPRWVIWGIEEALIGQIPIISESLSMARAAPHMRRRYLLKARDAIDIIYKWLTEKEIDR